MSLNLPELKKFTLQQGSSNEACSHGLMAGRPRVPLSQRPHLNEAPVPDAPLRTPTCLRAAHPVWQRASAPPVCSRCRLRCCPPAPPTRRLVNSLPSRLPPCPSQVEALPLTVGECRSLVRRLDTGATSFVRVADIERYLLTEAARRTKPGVATVVDGSATLAARAGAIGLAREDSAPAAAQPADFAVPEAVREAAKEVASLCDTNGDGWVQVDDVAEVARALSEHTVLGQSTVRWTADGRRQQHDGAVSALGRRKTSAATALPLRGPVRPGAAGVSHPCVAEAADRAARTAAVRNGPARVAEVWMVEDSDDDSDDDLDVDWGAGWGTCDAPARAEAPVPRLAIDRVALPCPAGVATAATVDPADGAAAGCCSAVDTTTRQGHARRANRRRAFASVGGVGLRFCGEADGGSRNSARTAAQAEGPAAGGITASAALSDRSGMSQDGPRTRNPVAGGKGAADHGFARKGRAGAACRSARLQRRAVAGALATAKFDPSDPLSFEALATRGCRVPASRLQAKAAELAQSTDRVVVPVLAAPSSARGLGPQAQFVSSARAAMESG